MAKKKAEETINIDNILFKCRDILRKARNSGSFFEKRDMMLTLVFLRFIGEKYEDGIKKLRERLIAEGLNPGDEKISNYCAAEKAKLAEIDLSLGGVTARCFASDVLIKIRSN